MAAVRVLRPVAIPSQERVRSGPHARRRRHIHSTGGLYRTQHTHTERKKKEEMKTKKVTRKWRDLIAPNTTGLAGESWSVLQDGLRWKSWKVAAIGEQCVIGGLSDRRRVGLGHHISLSDLTLLFWTPGMKYGYPEALSPRMVLFKLALLSVSHLAAPGR